MWAAAELLHTTSSMGSSFQTTTLCCKLKKMGHLQKEQKQD
jgi:hypothetical protein